MKSSRGPSRRRGRHDIVQPSARRGSPQDARRGRDRQANDLMSNDHDRRMELIASVSRSSGLEKDGDLLKDRIVQEEFRTYIDKRLEAFWDLHGIGFPAEPQAKSMQKQKRDGQENILILFRRLREGLFASGRRDSFALEVYETSLYLSVLFDSPVQTTSILSHLVPDFYSETPSLRTAPHTPHRATILILLLHQLIVTFPSQHAYLAQIKYLVPYLLERPSSTYVWVSTLARSLRALNFVQFERLSRPDAFEHLLPLSHPIPSSNTAASAPFRGLPRAAIHALVARLRLKARDEAWIVIRKAYRELSSSDETQAWLGKRLFFDSFGCETTVVRFDDWVRERCRDGQLRPKEGAEGKWVVCKVR